MKKLILTTTLLAITLSHAKYTTYIPLETFNGGALPNGSIMLGTNKAEEDTWITYNPTYSEWQTVDISNCVWLPAPESVTKGIEFTQTSTDCLLNESRFKQEQEISKISNVIRSYGDPIEELRETPTTIQPRLSIGTKITKECLYNVNLMGNESKTTITNGYVVRPLQEAPFFNHETYWNGEIIHMSSNYGSFEKDGYTYISGAYKTVETYGNQEDIDVYFYEICRTPL